MPNSTLPGSTYLGNGQRTTAEIQAGLDQVATWLNAAQAELNALTGTTFGEAAVRGVGTGATDLVENAELDTRLGTTGNLAVGDLDPSSPTLIWSGSPSSKSVGVPNWSDSGPGFYVVEFDSYASASKTDTYRHSFYWDGAFEFRSCAMVLGTAGIVESYTVELTEDKGWPGDGSIYVEYERRDYGGSSTEVGDGTQITNIWKL